MTYHNDPPRWTQTPGEAPELLRNGFESASREGPSEFQMRTLALKLAAVGTGAAMAAGAAGAKASTTAAGAGLASAGTAISATLTKVAVAIAVVGAATMGGGVLLRNAEGGKSSQDKAAEVAATQTAPAASLQAPQVAPSQAAEPSAQMAAPSAQMAAPVEAQLRDKLVQDTLPAPTEVAAADAPAQLEASAREATRSAENKEDGRVAKSERRHHSASETTGSARVEQNRTTASAAAPAVSQVSGQKAKPTEIDLLSKARAALAARPRDAYRLTEEHKSLYPQSMFQQEREALAVEALQRSGDLKHARELAEAFVKHYPSSPHAHRFRETMNIP